VYERIKNGEQMFVPSFNKKTFDIEWKKIERVSKRKGSLITIDVSQTGRVNGNTIDLTPNHKVLSIENLKIVEKEIEKILEENEMLCIVDKIPGIENTNQSNLAYLLGALFTDGYVQLTPNHGKVALIQKRTDEKIPFINTVKDCFEDVFGHPLTEGRTHTTTGIIRGQSITGTATEFICARKLPAESILKIKNNLVRWILSLDEDSLLNFLAGVIDGDGTWNKKHNVIQIYNGNEKVVHGIVLACLRLGIVPQISIQRKTCYNIQISEKLELLLRYTKRVKGNVRNRKYGTKLFAVKQLFKDYWKKMNWPFRQKANRNNLMNFKIILEHIHKYPQFKQRVMKIINSPLRMYRVKKVADIGQDFVFNLTVEDNHNYIVFTKNYTPVLVKNCHGAGRLLSRHAALKRFRGERVKAELAQRGISVRSASWGVLAEEAPGVYKNIHEVVRVCEVAGLSKTVAKLVPIGVVKG
jgi:pyruvate,water dikinase